MATGYFYHVLVEINEDHPSESKRRLIDIAMEAATPLALGRLKGR